SSAVVEHRRVAAPPRTSYRKRSPVAEDVTRFRLSVLRESFQHTRATLGLVWTASPRMTVALGALTLVSAVVPLAVAYVGKEIMDSVVARDGARTLRWVLTELAVVALQAVA